MIPKNVYWNQYIQIKFNLPKNALLDGPLILDIIYDTKSFASYSNRISLITLWFMIVVIGMMMNAINSRKKTQLKAQVKQSIRTIYLQFSTEHKCNWKDISDKKLVSLSSSKFRARGGFSGVSFGDQLHTYIFQKIGKEMIIKIKFIVITCSDIKSVAPTLQGTINN